MPKEAANGSAKKRRPWVTVGIVVVLVGSCVWGVDEFHGRTVARLARLEESYVVDEARHLLQPVEAHFQKFGKLPATLREVGIEPYYEKNWTDFGTRHSGTLRLEYSLSNDSVVVKFNDVWERGPVTLKFRPVGSRVVWDCYQGTLEKVYRPQECQHW